MSDSGKAVFLSYASQDAEAAKKICDALRAAGVEVWFDQSELVGGDAWDQKIRKQIKECALLIPIISASTQERTEGYFRLEWRLADQRTHLMAKGRPFLLPVVIDDTRDADAHVPDSFTEVQWTRLPGGAEGGKFAERVKALLSGGSNPHGSTPHAPFVAPSSELTAPAKTGKRWLPPVMAGAVIALVAVLLSRPWEKISSRSESTKPAAVVSADPNPAKGLSEARQLVERARSILANGGLTRAQLDTAGELCDRALQLDPTDAIVWNEAARTDLLLINPYGYDRSDERRKRAQFRATRALDLAPDLFEVRAMQAAVMAHAGGSPALLKEAEATFRELIASHPGDHNLVIQLAEVLREQKRFAEAATLFETIGEFEVAGWSYFIDGNPRAALAAVNRSLGLKRAVTALQLKAILQISVEQDLNAAQATVDQLRPSELLAELPAAAAIRAALFRRDHQRLLEIVPALPADYLNSNAFRGPKQYFTGLAHELAGRPGAAEAEWRAGLAVVQNRLKTAPDNRELLLWAAWLQATLGAKTEATRLLERAQEVAGLDRATVDENSAPVFLRLGRKEEFLAWLTTFLHAKAPQWEVTHAEVRFSPAYDPMRGDPRFEKLLRDTLPEGAKPFDEPKAVNDKSVAVLAFANLSEDKANEYFSDGVSEELLTVLQKIPGLKVSARTSAFSFKGKNATAQEIGRTLGVANLVEGSVRKAGTQVRITARLSRADTGEQLWSESYTRDLQDVFAVQTELAQAIVVALRAKLLGETGTEVRSQVASQVSTAQKGGTNNLEAHELYLQGKYFANQPSLANIDKAVDYFQRAVDADGSFALAWAALGRTVALQAEYFATTPQDLRERFARARRAVDRALALVPDLADGYFARIEIQGAYDFDWIGARESTERTLVLAPSNALFISNASQLAAQFGDLEKGIRLGRQAAELDPVNAEVRYWLGRVYQMADRLPEAEAEFRRAAELSPSVLSVHRQQSLLFVQQGRAEAAVAEARLEGSEWSRQAALAVACWAARDVRGADAALARLIEVAADSAGYQVAEAYAFRGEADHAFAWLERAYLNRDAGMGWVRMDPLLKNLHSDPRWPAFIRKVGLADDQLKP